MRTLRNSHGPHRGAFTLIELLVILGILGILAALLLPSLTRASLAGKRAACLANLRQIGAAIHAYAQDHDGRIPYGPEAPPFTHPAEFYPSTGSPTSLLSLRQDGAPVALGLLLKNELSKAPAALFCPGSDQPVDAQAELAKVGQTQAQGSYYYRHGGVTALFATPKAEPDCTRLADPGPNRNGKPIRALAIDTQFNCSPSLAAFNIKQRTHHRTEFADTLFFDGSARALDNRDGRYTVDLRSNADLGNAFSKILQVLERADEAD